MKNIKLFTIFTVLMLSAFVSTAWSWKGSGTSADPYIIKTCTDLETLRDSVNKDNDANRYDGVYFAQNDDIDCEKSTTWSEPIGKDEDHRFGGHYDGNNYKIINLAIISSSKYVGLFGYVQGAYDGHGNHYMTSLKNIVLEECYIENSAKDGYAAGICGRANYGYTYIDSCRVSGTINGKGGASGITAYSGANLYVTNNFVDVKLSADMKTTYDPIEGVNKEYMSVGKFFVSVPTDYGKEHVKNNYYHDNGDGVGPSSNSYNFTAGSFIPLYTVTGTGFTAASTGATVTLGGNAYFAANASVTLNADEYLIIEGTPTVSGEGASFGSVATDRRSMTVNVSSADVTVSATTSEVHTVSVPEGFTISEAYITIGDVKYYKTAEPYTLELNTENYIIDAISINGVPATIDDGKKTATFTMPSEDVTEIKPTTSEVHTVSVPEGFTISEAYITIGDVKYYKTAEPYTLELNTENYIIDAISINGVPATIDDGKKTATFKMPNQNVTIEATTSGIWGAGNGSEEAPYEISTPSELDILSKRVNNGSDYHGKFFKLAADINYTSTDGSDDNYTAIGNNDHVFNGNFDGAGKTIRGIRINKPSNRYQGLFGYLGEFAEVKNVKLADAVITGEYKVGGIAGQTRGSIYNCTVESSVEINAIIDDAEYYGGIAGYNENGTVSGCTSSAKITSLGADCLTFGGIVGYNSNNGTVSNNFVNGVTIPAVSEYYGAIVGNNCGSLSNNYYIASTVGGVKDATNVGVGSGNGIPSHDEIGDNGAIHTALYTIILGDGIAITTPQKPFYTDKDQNKYYAKDSKIELSYTEPDGKAFVYTINGTQIYDNQFTMPAENVNVGVKLISGEYWGIPKGANGSKQNPFQISTTSELDILAERVNAGEDFKGVHFELTANIEYAHTTEWGDISSTENNYTAIGTDGKPFNGKFNGNGFIISGIRIYKPFDKYQGLFGYLDKDAEIKNVMLFDAVITAKSYTGVIAGVEFGSLSNNYYTACTVNGVKDATNVGVGKNVDSDLPTYDVTDYNGAVSIHTVTLEGNSITSSEKPVYTDKDQNNYYARGTKITLSYTGGGKDFSFTVNGHPILNDHFIMPAEDIRVAVTFADYWGIADGANGTKENPYTISTIEDLSTLASFVNLGYNSDGMYFELKANIEYAHDTEWDATSSTENNFTAIGNSDNPFNGKFYGNGNTISGIRIYKPKELNQGLFGYLGNGAEVENVKLADMLITGGTQTGGIAGYNNGAIRNSTAESSVKIDAIEYHIGRHGGIVGHNVGSVSGCTSSATVTSSRLASDGYGGIVGYNRGSVSDCMSSATIMSLGSEKTIGYGGIAGSNDGSVSDCMSSATIMSFGIGVNYGGIVGSNGGSVSDCMSSATIMSFVIGVNYGGIVGSNGGSVSDCTSSATIIISNNKEGHADLGGIAGENIGGTLTDNLAIGATIPAADYSYGAIVGGTTASSEHNDFLSNNYYTACTVGEEKNASNVGIGNNGYEFAPHDVTENNGAVGVDYFSISGDYGEIHQSILPGATIEPIVINYKNVSDITCEGLPKGVECKDDLNGSIIISGNVKGDAVPGDYNYKVRGKTDIGWVALPGAITVRPLPTTSIKVASGNVEQTVTAGGDIEPIKFEYVDVNKFLLELFPSGEFSATEDSENKTLTITGTVAAAAKAGKYSARVVAEGKDANDTANVTINVTKPLTSETVTIADIPAQTYTGSEICPKVSIKDGEKELALNTGYSVECSNNVNAGTATMTITGNGNYTDKIEKTFKIAQALLTVTVSGDTITYGDGIPTLFEYTIEGLINGDQLNDVTISCGDCAISGYLAVGDHNLSISVDPTSNPNYKVTAVGNKLTVRHKKIKITDVTAKNRDYNGEKNVDLDGSKMTMEGYVENSDVSVDLSDATGTMEDANVGEDKAVTVTGIKLSGADAGNYDLKYSQNLTVTINKATPTVKAPEPIANLVYTGSAQPLVTAGETDFGTLLYSLDGKDYSAEIPAVSHAYAYTVYYKVEGSNNWNAVEANSVKVEIKPDTLIASGAVKILEDQNGGRAEIDGNYSGSEPVKISSQVAVDDVVINRSFTPLKPATVVLPCQLPKGTTVNADFYQLTEVSQKGCSWWASFNYIGEGVVPSANTPYAVVLHDSVSSGVLRFDMNGEMATCQTNTIDTTYVSGKSWYFVGVYSYKEWQEGDEELGLAYAFAGSDNEGGAAKGEFGKIKLKEGFTPHANPLRSYLRKRDKDVQLEASLCRASAVPSGMSLAPAYGVQFVPEPDVIEVEFVKNAFANGNGGGTTIIKGRYNTRTGEFKIYDADAKRTFDVKGRKLNGKPTAKGVYYGKKVAP